MRGKRYEVEKKIWGGDRKSSGKYCHLINQQTNTEPETHSSSLKTRDRLAEEYGIGARTIQSDAQFAKAVDILPAETKERIISGDLPVSKRESISVSSFGYRKIASASAFLT